MQNKIDYKFISKVDVNDILRLERSSFAPTVSWTSQMIQDTANTSTSRFYGAYLNGVLVSYSVISDLTFDFELLRICVSKEYRQLGIAFNLIQFILSDIKEKNQLSSSTESSFMLLEVSEDNYSAQRLYEKCGFSPIAVRKDYYLEDGVRKDAIIMKLFL